MTRRRRDREQIAGPGACITCGKQRPRDEQQRSLWTGADFLHCDGSTVAWHGQRKKDNPHHGHVIYPACWRCNYPLGCDECTGVVTEVLCRRCAAWGTPEALASHGPMLNTPTMIERRRGVIAPQLGAYPPEFRAAYNRAQAQDDPASFGGVGMPSTVKEIIDTVLGAVGIERGLPSEDDEERRMELHRQAQTLLRGTE